MRIKIAEEAQQIMRPINAAGGQALLVGGAVRDQVMAQVLGKQAPVSKDADIEVHRMTADLLEAQLLQLGRVDIVGKSFGVFKVTLHGGRQIDVSLPRRESKAGEGHRGFSVTAEPFMGIAEASSRRDFTMNAMLADINGNVVDPWGGIEDIRRGLLSATSIKFADDPLRVLRGVQFASRFGMTFNTD